jgi:hypothetical protein
VPVVKVRLGILESARQKMEASMHDSPKQGMEVPVFYRRLRPQLLRLPHRSGLPISSRMLRMLQKMQLTARQIELCDHDSYVADELDLPGTFAFYVVVLEHVSKRIVFGDDRYSDVFVWVARSRIFREATQTIWKGEDLCADVHCDGRRDR